MEVAAGRKAGATVRVVLEGRPVRCREASRPVKPVKEPLLDGEGEPGREDLGEADPEGPRPG